MTFRFKPFEFSEGAAVAGAFPGDAREAPGLALSGRSAFWGCKTPLPLGAALDWLKAGDFACELDGVSDTAAGTLDLVTGVWLTLVGCEL